MLVVVMVVVVAAAARGVCACVRVCVRVQAHTHFRPHSALPCAYLHACHAWQIKFMKRINQIIHHSSYIDRIGDILVRKPSYVSTPTCPGILSCLSIYLCIPSSVFPPVRPSVRPFVRPSIRLSVCPSFFSVQWRCADV